ncbi:hypothetical protein UFOVP116_19 [uncultured Caudovirales phage]|uniref:Uncharacterized protein n=1 Tax=uncultured Caudovirales phage TaxID=2100421 RepID=A0A6J5L442_9CAUD|nr:hypothetical protein UFOVP116_19 [uncultured Caudovirales phage]
MTRNFTVRRVFKNSEWSMNFLLIPPGETYKTHRMPGITESTLKFLSIPGRILDVPTDPTELIKFKELYPYCPFTDTNSKQVFIPANVTVVAMQRGEFEYAYAGTDGAWLPSTTEYPGMALPTFVATSPNSFQKNIKESKSYCCGPMEMNIPWERKVMTLRENEEYIVPQRNAMRRRLILCEGTISHNGTEVSGPTIINVDAGDSIKAATIVYCAEVWVIPT